MHDYFTSVIGEQVHVRPNPFAVTVIAATHDHFKVGRVFLFAVLFVEEFGGKGKIFDSFNQRFLGGGFARHVVFILL